MRVALLADFPIHVLPGFEHHAVGHHATWLPPLAQAMAPLTDDHSFHWITCTKHVSKPTRLTFQHQTFHLLPRGKLSIEILSGFQRERRLIHRAIQEIQPDLVHGWGTEQGYAQAACEAMLPSLISMQGLLGTYCATVRMPAFTRIQAYREAKTLKTVKHLTVESPWGIEKIRPLAPQAQHHLLEYAAAYSCFDITRQPSPTPLAIAIGTLSPLKGTDTLIQAFSDPRLRHIDLVILGQGSPPCHHAKLPSNIQLIGHQSPATVRDWLSKSWCLVHPTRADTSPNCVKEARVIGIPVVTTTAGGQIQYVIHGKSGFIHPPSDIDGLIDGVLRLTHDRETSLQMGSFDHQRVREALHPNTTATRLLAIYQEVMKSHHILPDTRSKRFD